MPLGYLVCPWLGGGCFSRYGVRLGCFFFQAEDGIRDSSVTGVQTCALPISHLLTFLSTQRRRSRNGRLGSGTRISRRAAARRDSRVRNRAGDADSLRGVPEIGRASCRERV